MPTEQILSEEQIAEIEKHYEISIDSKFASSQIPALCQTVRAAWAKVVEETERADENFIAYDRVKGKYSETVNRLSEVTKERDDLSEEMETCHSLLDQFYSEDPAMASADTLEQRLKLHLDELRPVITDDDVNGDD